MSDEQKNEAEETPETASAPTEPEPEPEQKEKSPATEEAASEKKMPEPGAEQVQDQPAAEPPAQPQESSEQEQEEETSPPDAQVELVGMEEIKPGMTIRVHERIKDVNTKGEEKERIQVFEGMVLSIRGAGISRSMTVRKVSKNYGVEKIYPILSPVIAKIELVKSAKVRKAKLWYLADTKKRFKRKLKETWVK